MKKSYHPPKTECINVATIILAASTARSTRNKGETPAYNTPCNNDWGNIWDE